MDRCLGALLVALGVLLVTGCTADTQNDPRPRVVCTTGLVADLVQQIAGDRVQLITLMPPSVDPHLYQASPRDIHHLYSADLIVYSGLHLEGRMAVVLERMAKLRSVVAVTSALSREQLLPEANSNDPDQADEEMVDPHVWMDVTRWSTAIPIVRDALIGVDPEGSAEYQRRADEYSQQLELLDAECRAMLDRIPAERRVLVTAHDAFGYLGDAYGIEVQAIQGLSTESEASVRDINTLVHFLVDHRIPAIFVESSINDRNVRALVEGCGANGHSIRIGGELYSDALGEPGSGAEAYIGMIRHNAGTIARALQ